ncbi:MAG: hypothetical protein HWE07_04590 [Cytophagia bacterium]|nr:hypothetical protein [Cytophagia bacterium]
MKKREIITILIILGLILLAFSCNPDDPIEPSLQDLTYENLAGEWALGQFSSIKVDGADVSANYPGFSLSFAEGTYTTTNAGNLFSPNGTWEWTDTDATQVNLDDGKVISIQSLTTSKFVFSFIKSDGPVRAGLAGSYTITVEK